MTDALVDPCRGRCGAGTVCDDGRCVALDAGGDAKHFDTPALDVALDDAAEERETDVASTDVASVDALDCGPGRTPSDGACGCATGLTMCRSGCSNTSTDPVNCGVCSRSCRADEACRAGTCVSAADASIAADVCTSTTDPSNCCGVDCPLRINGIRFCSSGRCGFSCIPGFADCDGTTANGCESASSIDSTNCGACGNACRPGHPCAGGRCATDCDLGCPAGTRCVGSGCVACDAPTSLCGAECVDLATNRNHCGACGRVCAVATGGTSAAATTACVAGRCIVTACTLASEGYTDCDGDAANGCETNLNTRANCGACGRACSGDLSCTTGRVCTCSNLATNMCGDRCVRPSDPSHCGRCGNACTDAQFCDGLAGVCRDCPRTPDGHMLTRCVETCRDLMADDQNCGACGVVCPLGRICFFGVCR